MFDNWIIFELNLKKKIVYEFIVERHCDFNVDRYDADEICCLTETDSWFHGKGALQRGRTGTAGGTRTGSALSVRLISS